MMDMNLYYKIEYSLTCAFRSLFKIEVTSNKILGIGSEIEALFLWDAIFSRENASRVSMKHIEQGSSKIPSG